MTNTRMSIAFTVIKDQIPQTQGPASIRKTIFPKYYPIGGLLQQKDLIVFIIRYQANRSKENSKVFKLKDKKNYHQKQKIQFKDKDKAN